MENNLKTQVKNEESMYNEHYIKNLLGIMSAVSGREEYYLSKNIMKKSAPWYNDIINYDATPETSIKNFDTYHPVFYGYKCQLMRTSFGFWCGFVHLPTTHVDFYGISNGNLPNCYNSLVKTENGVFGFYCNGKTDLIPVANAKNWKLLKRQKSYKKYLFVKKKLEELAKEFSIRETVALLEKQSDDNILENLIIEESN